VVEGVEGRETEKGTGRVLGGRTQRWEELSLTFCDVNVGWFVRNLERWR